MLDLVAHLVDLRRWAQLMVEGRVVRPLPAFGPVLLLDLPPAFEVVWQGVDDAGTITRLTPTETTTTRLDAPGRRMPLR